MTRLSLVSFLWTALFLGSANSFVVRPTATTTTTTTRQGQPLHFFKNVLESLVPSESSSTSPATAQQRETLKQALLEECQSTTTRENIQAIIDQLKDLSPTPASAASPLLQKKWRLEWTTEKEINFFLDWNLSNDIGQTIAGTNLDNNIEFVRGGGFYVSGVLDIPDAQGVRTNFEFETATLDLGKKWGQWNFPPVGAGWFDTIYLDDSLRVDVNSRDDILICTPY